MSNFELTIFIAMVFGTVILLSMAVILPTVGSDARASRRMRRRISRTLDIDNREQSSLMRENPKKERAKDDRGWLNHPLMQRLDVSIQQAGLKIPVQRVLGTSLMLGVVGGVLAWLATASVLAMLLGGLALMTLPFLRIRSRRKRRLDKFEEQLPAALDIMSRALKAGHPFNETLNFVAEEMDEPIAGEFSRVFSDINYGMASKTAFHALMIRIPSVSLHTLVTAVLIQQESGGALAEILEKVADVIRGRFKLQRRVRSLSAEGRMSAWVLSLIPFGLAGMLMVVSPDYLPVLLDEPIGQKMILTAFGLIVVGVLWIRRIINVKV